MSVLIILMLVSLAVGLTFLGAFIWSVRSGQYEDTLTPALRVLLDDPAPPQPGESGGARPVRFPKAGTKPLPTPAALEPVAAPGDRHTSLTENEADSLPPTNNQQPNCD
jgi:cbb3-type cytochrome oxidase maturation protein